MQRFGHKKLSDGLRGELGDGVAVLVDLIGYKEAIEAERWLQRFEEFVDVFFREWWLSALRTLLVLLLLQKYKHHIEKKTRGQRPNESQKAVIIDMIKSVGEIASKMWPVV